MSGQKNGTEREEARSRDHIREREGGVKTGGEGREERGDSKRKKGGEGEERRKEKREEKRG